tara:strand:- start:2187 stop:2381 length:195 start_codon:yes stop_codon:yes gene_type:complete
MPTKCFTKATKTGKKYTACVDTKTFKKKRRKKSAPRPSKKSLSETPTPPLFWKSQIQNDFPAYK